MRAMIEKSLDNIDTSGIVRTRSTTSVPEILDALNTFVLQTAHEYSAKQAAEEAVDFYTKSNNSTTPIP